MNDHLVPRRARASRALGSVYARAVLPIAAVLGLWTSWQASLDPAAARQGHLLWASLVRSTAPAASGSALLLALIWWAHPQHPAALPPALPRALGRAALLALPGYLAAAGVALLAGVGLGSVGRFTLSPRDFAVGAAFAALDSALVLALGWRFLPRLQRASSTLPAKLSVALAVTVPLRAAVGLAAASLLSP